MKRYDITDSNDRIRPELHDWLVATLPKDHYIITNDGYFIDAYYVKFNNPAAETLFVLKWL